jgi:hypothetical protein
MTHKSIALIAVASVELTAINLVNMRIMVSLGKFDERFVE